MVPGVDIELVLEGSSTYKNRIALEFAADRIDGQDESTHCL